MTRKPLTFLALGDSYTIGESVDSRENWPNQLVAIAGREGITFREPRIVAKTGWTTAELLDAIRKEGVRGRFDLVTLLIGVNNLYRGRTVTEFREEFRTLLGLAVGYAAAGSGNVLVLSIPDWGATPFADGRDRSAISRTTDEFNAVLAAEARGRGTLYLDVTGESRKGLEDTSLVTSDALHPSGLMYRAWARMAFPMLFDSDGPLKEFREHG